MKNFFICPSKGCSDEVIDKVLGEVRPFANDVYVREIDASNEYVKVLGVTKKGRALDLDLSWGKYTELAHVLIGVEKCDDIVFCGNMKTDIVCGMLFAILQMHDSEFGQKNVYLFNGDKIVKV